MFNITEIYDNVSKVINFHSECIKNKDLKGLSEILSDDLNYRDVSGQYCSKDEYIDAIKQGYLIYYKPLREGNDYSYTEKTGEPVVSVVNRVLIRPFKNDTDVIIRTDFKFKIRNGKYIITSMEKTDELGNT